MCAARGRGTRCRERQQRKGVPLRGTGQGGNAFGAPALSLPPPHPHLHTAPSHLLLCSAGMVTFFSGLLIIAGCFQRQLQNQGQGQATFGSPSVPAGSSALLRPSPAGGLQSPPNPFGFRASLGSDGEGQGHRLLRPFRSRRVHRPGVAGALRSPRRSDVSGVCILSVR
jgi:hypothetical protein